MAAVSPDNQSVVTVSHDTTARLWDAATGQPRGQPLRHGETVTAVAFSPNGQTVVTGSHDGTARLWNVPPPAVDDLARVQLSVEVHTGYYTDSRGVHRTLNQTPWLDRRRQLESLGGPCIIRNWKDLTPADRESAAATAPSKP